MSAIKVAMKLPFFLRVEETYSVAYEQVCRESQVNELIGKEVQITFSRRLADVDADKSSVLFDIPHTTVELSVESTADLSDDLINKFAIRNCREIINRLITAYQATTGEITNAGFISPFGTTDMQLFADICVDGVDFRDRWPSHSLNTFPLDKDADEKCRSYLVGDEDLPLSSLILTNARLLLEKGQYPLAVLQAVTAVEIRTTLFISDKLRNAGWSDEAIAPYQRRPLSEKLSYKQTDPRSLITYFVGVAAFADVLNKATQILKLRNGIVHRGEFPTHEETIEAFVIARDFLRIVT